MNHEKGVENIRNELKDYLKKSGLKSLVIGVSGGLDSTACILLAKPVCDELGISLIGRYIGIESNSPEEMARASSMEPFCTSYLNMDITHTYNQVKYVMDLEASTSAASDRSDDLSTKIRLGNTKARLRMITLYNLASMYNGMVLSTDNKTEYLLGFWTLHGDVGDYGMIQELWKTEVYDIVEWIKTNEIKDTHSKKIIDVVINADATDGLGITNTDLDQILPDFKGDSRSGYEIVDMIMASHLESGIGNLDDPVLQRYHRTHFKRNNPYNIPLHKIIK